MERNYGIHSTVQKIIVPDLCRHIIYIVGVNYKSIFIFLTTTTGTICLNEVIGGYGNGIVIGSAALGSDSESGRTRLNRESSSESIQFHIPFHILIHVNAAQQLLSTNV